MSESIELILEQLDELEEKDKEIERLNNKINKAIDYIKKVSNNGMFEIEMDEIEELLDILKENK